MKRPVHLPALPSVGELLEHPRVKSVVSRINRSTLAQRAGGFLDELRGSLAARVGGDVPSLAQLAERLARRLLAEPATSVGVINATGLVIGDPDLAPPLAESALHAVFQAGAEYRRDHAIRRRAVEAELAELVGAEAACGVSSLDAALVLAVAAVAGGREAQVLGAPADDSPDPVDWQRLGARAGATIRQTPVRGGALGGGGSAAALKPLAIRAPDADLSLADLAPACQGACLLDLAPAAGVIDPADFGLAPVETIARRLAAGADLVLVDGAGLLGGPACGLAFGPRRWVEPLTRHPLADLVALDPLSLAALGATAAAYQVRTTPPAHLQAPVWQLLSAPVANLQQRAERLAPLAAATGAVAAAAAEPLVSAWRCWGERRWEAPSWGIRLTPHDGDAEGLRTLLARPPYPIVGRVDAASVILDLRTVFPRWDQQLVAALETAGAT